MSSGSDESAPRPPRPAIVVWAHRYGQGVHQEGKSNKEWQAELFSAIQSRLAHEIRDCEAISAQVAAAFKAHQAEEARKKVGVKKATPASPTIICNINDAQPLDSRSGMASNELVQVLLSLTINACEGCNKVRQGR